MNLVVVGIISRINKNNEQEFLLMSSKEDFGKFTDFYYPPGGHQENSETEQQTLTREIKEELGVKVNVLSKIAQTAGDVPDQITSWWQCDLQFIDFKLSSEVADIKWFTKEKILKSNVIWPATKSFFKAYL